MIAIQIFLSVLLTVMFNMGTYQLSQQPTSVPTTTPSPVIVPTSPASATSAALFTTSTALAATTQALLNRSPQGPTSQTPRELPRTGGGASPRSVLAGLILLLLMAGGWLRHRSKAIHHQDTKAPR